jgi:hypothetical protein
MSTGNHGPVPSERAIENLISSYAFLNDDADIAGLGELFAGAVFTLDETTARGREEIEQRARGIIQVNEDGTSQTRHHITNLIIEVDEEAGTATAPGVLDCPAVRLRPSAAARPRRALPEPIPTPRRHMALHRTQSDDHLVRRLTRAGGSDIWPA